MLQFHFANVFLQKVAKCCQIVARCQHIKEELLEKNLNPRFNAVGIQMISENLHKQIFKESCSENSTTTMNDDQLNEVINHLSSFNLWNKPSETLPDIDFELPKLHGNNIKQHFDQIAKQQTEKYVKNLLELTQNKIPAKPNASFWQQKAGWTKYVRNDEGAIVIQPIKTPDSGALVFDCEVLVKHSDIPIIAVAVSKDAWYSWTSKHVLKENSKLENDIEYLVPMEQKSKSSVPKIVVGHNVGFDRARIKEQYFLNCSSTRFLDTMSMHIAVSGFSSQQRISSKLSNSDIESNEVLESSWVQAGSLNNLNAVHSFYCGHSLDKSARETFVSGSMKDVQHDFNELMDYCAKDVLATFNVLEKLLPQFFAHFPHRASFAGLLEIGQMYLPINNNWQRYVNSCQQEYANLTLELKRTLIDRMNDACHLIQDEKYKDDKWLWDLDWNVKNRKMIMSPRKGFVPKDPEQFHLNSYFDLPNYYTANELKALGKTPSSDSTNFPLLDEAFKTADRLPLVKPHMPGSPQWYKELQEKETDPNWDLDACKLSTLTRATPKLLRMTWLGYPLHYCDKLGWGYLVPSNADNVLLSEKNVKFSGKEDAFEEVEEMDSELSDANVVHTPEEDIEGLLDGYTFHRLPHKDGIDKNVGSPLSQSFIHHVESGLLSSSDYFNARRCLEINKLCSYWRSAQKRILSQMRVYVGEEYLPKSVTESDTYSKDNKFGVIVPQVIACGAISRRAVERTWLTASNIESDRIGSELKSMIQAPPGYCFVGADVDSQELWIASLLGDAAFHGEHGCTALSWMTLQGNKKDGTDLHSKTAQAIGMTRNDAKTFNYARMYGAGRQAALRTYMQHNPNQNKEECLKRINKLYDMTKGKLLYRLTDDALWLAKKTNVQLSPSAKLNGFGTYEDVLKIHKAGHDAFGQSRVFSKNELIAGKKWRGGIESQMFNRMEEIAMSEVPRTPVLKSQISTALRPSKVGFNYLPSRMNWVVQSSAVDYLHLLLVSMRWLIEKYELDARFVLSIHDEVHYLSSLKDQHRVTLALQIANLLTRCMFAYQLGMHDLPLNVAFFSAIEIDQVIRKEATDNCITPSNPGGLETKYGIPLGKSLNIFDILKITKGKLD